MGDLFGAERPVDALSLPSEGDFALGENLAVRLRQVLVLRLRGLGVPPQETEDLAQQCLIEIVETIQRFDSGKGSLEAWAAGIARNVARNWRRTQVRRMTEPLEEAIARPLMSDAGAESVAAVSEALSGLNLIDRELLHMRFALGMSFSEIEAQTDLTQANARKRVSRAVETLRRHPAIQALLA